MIGITFQCNNKEGTSEDRDLERAGHMEGLDVYLQLICWNVIICSQNTNTNPTSDYKNHIESKLLSANAVHLGCK